MNKLIGITTMGLLPMTAKQNGFVTLLAKIGVLRRKAQVLSKIDLVRAYQLITTAVEDIPKTAITESLFDLCEFIRLTFGLRNAAQSFQRFMDEIPRSGFAFAYIDDVIIASPSMEEHLDYLEKVLKRFVEF